MVFNGLINQNEVSGTELSAASVPALATSTLETDITSTAGDAGEYIDFSTLMTNLSPPTDSATAEDSEVVEDLSAVTQEPIDELDFSGGAMQPIELPLAKVDLNELSTTSGAESVPKPKLEPAQTNEAIAAPYHAPGDIATQASQNILAAQTEGGTESKLALHEKIISSDFSILSRPNSNVETTAEATELLLNRPEALYVQRPLIDTEITDEPIAHSLSSEFSDALSFDDSVNVVSIGNADSEVSTHFWQETLLFNSKTNLGEAAEHPHSATADLVLADLAITADSFSSNLQSHFDLEPIANDLLIGTPSKANASNVEIVNHLTQATSETSIATITQVSDFMLEEMKLTQSQQQKTITLQLHPEDLGNVSVQLDWDHEGLRAQIMTSERIAGEILNQNKSQLLTALAESGYDVTSLDIGHEPSNQDSDPTGGNARDSHHAGKDNAFEEDSKKDVEINRRNSLAVSAKSSIDIRI